MNKITKGLFLIITATLFFAFLYSKSLIVACQIAYIVIALFEVNTNPLRIRFHPGLKRVKDSLKVKERFNDNLAFYLVVLFFLLVLFNVLFTGITDYGLDRIRIKLPFVVLPFAFLALPAIDKKMYFNIHFMLQAVMVIGMIITLTPFINNLNDIMETYLTGSSIPMKISHIRFSLLLALSAMSGIVLLVEGHEFPLKWLRIVCGVFTLLIITGLHIFAVRSGLVTFYLATILYAIIKISQRSIPAMIVVLVLIIGLPLVAFYSVPSFQNRIKYMKWDWEMYKSGQGGINSDSNRILSIKVGLSIFKENPVFGIGIGQLREEVHNRNKDLNDDLNKIIMPHNQFVSIAAGSGIIGLIIFCFAFFGPIFYRQNFKYSLFWILSFIILLSMLVENTMETSVGVAIYSFFLLLGLNHMKGSK